MALPSRLIALYDAALRARLRARPRPAPQGLLLVRSGGLGDTICFSHLFPRFRALAAPGEPAAFLTPAAGRAAAFMLGPDIEIIAVDYPRFRRSLKYRAEISGALYARGFRRVVSTDHLRHPLIDEAMIAACAAPVTEAMTARPWPKHQRRLNANRRFFTRLTGAPADLHVLERWTALANALSGRNDPLPRTVLPPEALPPPEKLARPAAVLQPYTSTPGKQPAPELCLKIIDALGPDMDVAVKGAPDDRARSPEYEILFSRPNVRFDGRSFEDALPLLRAARIVISAETALMHLAVACGAPTAALCCDGYIGDMIPYPEAARAAAARFIYTPMPCEGCFGNCVLPPEGGRWPCVARLDPDRVIAEIRALLNAAPGAPEEKT